MCSAFRWPARRSLWRCVAVLVLLASAVAGMPLSAQGVLIAPQSVIIDHRARSGTFEVYNPTAQPAEVTVSTVFGYPTTDSAGVVGVSTWDTPPVGEPSAAGWLQAFPRRFVLQPQERQTVRLLGRPPANLADGEYWSRLIVGTTGATPLRQPGDTTPVQVAVALEVRTILGVLYRKGAQRTALRVANVRMVPSPDSVARVRVDYTREGPSAFLGTVTVTLRDAAGRTVRTFDRRLAVYRPLSPAYDIPVRGLPPGRYWAVVRVATERDDIAPELVLKAPPVRDSVAVTLPPTR
jgi:P pilus assembly chaperone PapD